MTHLHPQCLQIHALIVALGVQALIVGIAPDVERGGVLYLAAGTVGTLQADPAMRQSFAVLIDDCREVV